MRGVRHVAVALGICLAGAGGVRAGLYNPAEPEGKLPERFEDFRDTVLIPLRQFGTPEGRQPVHRRAVLVTLQPPALGAKLTADERLSLSAYFIRMRKFREAIDILRPVQGMPRERDNFLIYANRATAEFLDGQTQGARDTLAAALEVWPREWSQLSKARREWLEKMGWTKDHFDLCRRAETYFLKLIRLRARERRPAPGKAANPLGHEVEPLFDDGGRPPRPVAFVGDKRTYEAGKIAPAEAAKLPADAERILKQLLVWLPHDERLYWLLGEVLNARGAYMTAGEIFAEIGKKLQAAANNPNDPFSKAPVATGPEKLKFLHDRRPDEFAQLPELHKQHLGVLIRRAKADQTAVVQPPDSDPPRGDGVSPRPAVTHPPKKPDSGGSLPIDLRSLAVGFVAGLIVMAFGFWQVREIRRRLQARAVEREEGRTG